MEAATAPQFNFEEVGNWYDANDFVVEQERMIAYAKATNDDVPQHASGEVASPCFSIVPAFMAMGQTAMKVIPGQLIGMILHGEQDFHFHKPITAGMTLSTRSTVVGIHTRSSGTTVVAKIELSDKDELVTSMYATTFVRGADAGDSQGEEAPAHSFVDSVRENEPLGEVTQSFDEDQTYRYSEASGDPMPIHLDDDFAKQMGLPGIIIHGMCTMAFTSGAVIQTACPEDPTRLKRLAVRFSKIVLPANTITTKVWQGDGGVAFETTLDDGAPAIKDGWAEIS